MATSEIRFYEGRIATTIVATEVTLQYPKVKEIMSKDIKRATISESELREMVKGDKEEAEELGADLP